MPFTASKNFMYVPMDFTNPVDVYDVFTNIQPDAVIHAGAMGKPDECELNQMQAYITNTEGTMNLLHQAGFYSPDKLAAAEALRLPGALCFLLCAAHSTDLAKEKTHG